MSDVDPNLGSWRQHLPYAQGLGFAFHSGGRELPEVEQLPGRPPGRLADHHPIYWGDPLQS
jgi:hypothetical protein